jgi:hypothetical protein
LANSKVGTYQTDKFASHNHTGTLSTDGDHNHATDAYDVQVVHNGYTTEIGADNVDPGNNEICLAGFHPLHNAGAHTHTVTIAASGGNEKRPKNAYVNYIIKY